MNEHTDRDLAVQKVRGFIEKLACEKELTARDGTVHQVFPRSVDPGEGAAYREWVVRENATRTIEVGFAHGFSALHICEGLLLNGNEGMQHTVMDPHQLTAYTNCGLEVFEDAGLSDLVEFYPEMSQIVLPRLLQEARTFDLAFIDGNHRFEYVFLDLFYLGQLVRKGGVIMLDDYNMEGIKRAVSYYVKNRDWKIEDTIEDGHSVVLRTPETEKEWHYRDFVEF